MTTVNDLVNRLMKCPAGVAGWRLFEDVCVEILSHLFVPPLTVPRRQVRTFSGIERMDAIFPNRNFGASDNWALLYKELEARLILFEFKNYNNCVIGAEEVTQTLTYMKPTMGKLALMVCNQPPSKSAYTKRNSVYTNHGGLVILFLTREDLRDMLYAKERGEDPSDLLIDLLDTFRIEYE